MFSPFRKIIELLQKILEAVESEDSDDDSPENPGKSPEKPDNLPSKPVFRGSETATVTRVIDGDTFEVELEDKTRRTVRLLGVDTPETAKRYMDPSEYGVPDTEQGRQHLLEWGHKTEEYTRKTLEGETVEIATDPAAGSRDPYGRVLAYLKVNGEPFCRDLLRQGLARVYTGETFALEDRFLKIEKQAMENGVGMWGFEE
jgi:micrococcal nuclease